MRIKPVIILFYMFIIMIQACKQDQNEISKISITVIPKGTTHVFWQSIHAGAIKASRETDVEITWVGPERDDDRQQQIALVDNQVMNQVSGIVLAPIDDTAMKRPVRNAVNNGIPVVIIDSGLKDSENIYTSFIATDNTKGGYIGGKELAKLLNGKGKVAMLREAEGAASTQKRAAGFLDAINSYPEIEVVSHEQYAGASKAKAQQLSENLLFRFQDQTGRLTIDGIFCVNESTTYGMLQALRRKRLVGKIKFVGFDSAPPLIEGLKRGEIHGLVVQNPFKMGYLGVKTMVSYLQGHRIEKLVDTGVSFVTADNLNKAEIKELLYPDLEKWLSQ